MIIQNKCTGRKIVNPSHHYLTAYKNSTIDGTWVIINKNNHEKNK